MPIVEMVLASIAGGVIGWFIGEAIWLVLVTVFKF